MMGMHTNQLQGDTEVLAPEYACSAQMSWGSGGLDLSSVQLSVDPEDAQCLLYSPQAASHQPGQLAAVISEYAVPAGPSDRAGAAQLQHLRQHAQPAQLQHWQPQSQAGMQELTMHPQQEASRDSHADMTYVGFHMQHQPPQQQSMHQPQQQQPPQPQQQETGQQRRQWLQVQQQQQQQRWQPHGSPKRNPVVGVCVPALNLSRVKMGSSSQVRNLPDDAAAASEALAEKEAELCFERGSVRQSKLHPSAPLQDSRCYIYKAAGRKELTDLYNLLSRLPEQEGCEVTALWDALMVARHDCEAMAARGVRVSRDISRDWQETVSDLIDRVVAQDNELGQLRQQLKAMQAVQAGTAGSPSPASPAAANLEELHAQVVRLKRQRDLLRRDQQELSRAKNELQEALEQARQEAAAAKEQHAAVNTYATALREQHISLLRQLSTAAEYAESIEAALVAKQSAPAATDPDQDRLDQACRTPGGSFSAARSSCGRRSPLAGVFAAGALTADAALMAAPELSLDLSCSRLAVPGLPPSGRSRCTTPSPRSSSTAFSRKLNTQTAPVLPCSRGDRGSGTSSPIYGTSMKSGTYLTSATASGGAGSPARNSDDALDTAHDRLASAHPAIAASREVDQYGQQGAAEVPPDVLGVASSKGVSRLQLAGPLAVCAAAAKLTPRLGATPRLASSMDDNRVTIRQTVESYTHEFKVIDALYAAC